MGPCQGIREVVGEYVCIEGAREAYLQYRQDILKKKYWENGVDFLERAMGSLWLKWSVGSRYFFWSWTREHQRWTEEVAGGTMASVSPDTDSGKRQESGGKGMHQVVEGQE